MENERYNGWKNYETWNVSLWIDNDQGLYERAREIVNNNNWKHNCDCWDCMKEFVEEWIEFDEMEASCAKDLLGAALSKVDWKEICDSYFDKD